jgi:hypothetical protein
MALTGLAAGLLVPVIAIGAAITGICEPFSLQIARRRWTFGRNRSVLYMDTDIVAGNFCVPYEMHMMATGVYIEQSLSASSVTTVKLAA